MDSKKSPWKWASIVSLMLSLLIPLGMLAAQGLGASMSRPAIIRWVGMIMILMGVCVAASAQDSVVTGTFALRYSAFSRKTHPTAFWIGVAVCFVAGAVMLAIGAAWTFTGRPVGS